MACSDTLLPSFQDNYMLITLEELENKQAAAFNEAFIAVRRTMKKAFKAAHLLLYSGSLSFPEAVAMRNWMLSSLDL